MPWWPGSTGRAPRRPQLEEFLFGAERIALERVRADLRDLQGNRYFYCDDAISVATDVDHFIPWPRYADNGLANLVVAHARCNSVKRDFLAAPSHVARWTERLEQRADDLEEIAVRIRWDHHPDRMLNVARAIYLRLPSGMKLWLRGRVFVGVERGALTKARRPIPPA